MLTAAQLAAALGICERQVRRLAVAGMPSTPIGSRGRRYDQQECQQWLRENEQCLSNAPRKAATRSVSASAINAYTAASRRAQVRVTPSNWKPSSDEPSGMEPSPLSLVTRR